MMGYEGPAHVLKEHTFGPGYGPIWLDELGCHGTETTVLDCVRLPWAKHNCRHSEDVAIRCSNRTAVQVRSEILLRRNPSQSLTGCRMTYYYSGVTSRQEK